GAAPALSSVVFNENEVLKAFGPNLAFTGNTIQAWYNDEHAMLLGVRQITVKTTAGTTTTNHTITPWDSTLSAVNPSLGATALTGEQSGTDLATWNAAYGYTDHGRPLWPALFIT